MEEQDLQERILNAAIEEFERIGLKFTMDDIARNLRISKKTLYTVYENKEAMLMALVDHCFRDIKESEAAVMEDEELDLVTRLERILVVLPDRYENIGLGKLYQLKEKYPKVYERVSMYLTTGWDSTIALINQGIEEGLLRPVSIPVLKVMVESTIEHFFSDDVLVENNIYYEEALHEMVEIIIQGIKK
jgi:AcrR family transcriptional regulator